MRTKNIKLFVHKYHQKLLYAQSATTNITIYEPVHLFYVH